MLARQPKLIATMTDFMSEKAIILCTRPMLLRSVRLKVEQQQKMEMTEIVPEMLARLCDTCSEAATRSLAILHSLQRQKTIRESDYMSDATVQITNATFCQLATAFSISTRHSLRHLSSSWRALSIVRNVNRLQL